MEELELIEKGLGMGDTYVDAGVPDQTDTLAYNPRPEQPLFYLSYVCNSV